jgi:hypothetical protein
VTELLGVVVLLVKQYKKHFSTGFDRLLHVVVFPLLGVTAEEEQLFADDPTEFNSLA